MDSKFQDFDELMMEEGRTNMEDIACSIQQYGEEPQDSDEEGE